MKLVYSIENVLLSLLPLENAHNQRVLVRLNTILTCIVAITCMFNVLSSSLVFAESKESFFQPQPIGDIIIEESEWRRQFIYKWNEFTLHASNVCCLSNNLETFHICSQNTFQRPKKWFNLKKRELLVSVASWNLLFQDQINPFFFHL